MTSSDPTGRPAAAPDRPAFGRVIVATVLGNLYLIVGSVACALLALVAALLPRRGDPIYRVARLWARGLLAASRVGLEVHGAAPRLAGERRVFMANHQSLFDIPALLVALPDPARFLAKRSLFRIPVFGWAMRAGGFVPIDRDDRVSARRSFSAALEHLSAGASLVVFPEAERTLDGRLLPFQRGGFLLALRSGWPIVPIGIAGALAVQPRHSFLIRPRTITVRLGEPIVVRERSVRQLDGLVAEVERTVAQLAGVELAQETAPAGV